MSKASELAKEMTTVTAPDSAVTQSKPARDNDSSLAQRGTTTIPANVVARIAAQAASEFAAVGSTQAGSWGSVRTETSVPGPRPSVSSTGNARFFTWI